MKYPTSSIGELRIDENQLGYIEMQKGWNTIIIVNRLKQIKFGEQIQKEWVRTLGKITTTQTQIRKPKNLTRDTYKLRQHRLRKCQT